MKKGEMSLTFIIGVVIAILILVILVVMISKPTENYQSASSCVVEGKLCKTERTNSACSSYTGKEVGCPEGKYCCPVMP